MIYVATRTGKHHELSEDAALVGKTILSNENATLPVPKNDFICVADGVGGNDGGACASSFVLQKLLTSDITSNPEELKAILVSINNLLIEKGIAEPGLSSMATTLTGVLVGEESHLVIHVGNTRAYVQQGRYLKQVTQDHTTFNWLQKTGRYEEAELCNKSEITNCFGGGTPSLLSKLYVASLSNFACMLLTSDGVHEYVDIDLLEDILNTDSSGEDKCNSIIDAALAAGSEDDMTVILICMNED